MPTCRSSGTEIHFEDVGSGTPLVLGHSFLCSGEMWTPQVAALSKLYRVINIDWPGHGQSDPINAPFSLVDYAHHVVAVLDHVGVERAVWAGLSIGGMVALRGALHFPERVSGLILMDTHAGPENGYIVLKYRLMAMGARLMGVRPFVPAILRLMFGSTTRRNNKELVEDWRPRFQKVDVPSMLYTLEALIARETLIPLLARIEVPTLVMVGDEDKTLPPPYAEEIANGIHAAQLIAVPGAGHLAALERPDLVNAAIVEFLDQLT